jgi:signal transduction histidine kinase
VLYNFIDNAVKFTDDNGKVSISSYNKNNAIYFEVNDNGIGISQNDLKKIYTSMEENINSKDLLSNTTIGLLTVKKYVEAHNGKVMVSSIVGKGSTFSFNIPYSI